MIRVGELLTIDLPGEKTRAVIRKILSPTKLILELTNVPLAKSHSYKKDDFVACVKKKSIFGEFWQAIETKPNLEDFLEKINDTRSITGTDGKNSKKPRSKINGTA